MSNAYEKSGVDVQKGYESVERIKKHVASTLRSEVMSGLGSFGALFKLDLSKYKGKTVQRYTYEITNYPDYSGTVYANIIIYKSRVIGGDICSSDVEGFIQGFEMAKAK